MVIKCPFAISGWEKQCQHVSELHKAAFLGDLGAVQRLVKQGGNVNVRTTSGPKLLKNDVTDAVDYGITFSGFFLDTTPLHIASQQGRLEVARFLVDHCKAHVNATDSLGVTSLAMACAFNHVHVAEFLISRGANRELREAYTGMTPLILACVNNHVKIVKMLVKHLADVKAKDVYGRMAIHYAAWNYNSELVEYLNSHDGKHHTINAQDHDGNTPLHLLVSEIEADHVANTSKAAKTDEIETKGAATCNIGEKPVLAVSSSVSKTKRCNGDFQSNKTRSRKITKRTKKLPIYITATTRRGSGAPGEDYLCLVHMLKLGSSYAIKNNEGRTVLHTLCAHMNKLVFRNGFLYTEAPTLNLSLLVMLKILLKTGIKTDEQDYHGDTPSILCDKRENWMAANLLHPNYTEKKNGVTYGHRYRRDGGISSTALEVDIEQIASSTLQNKEKNKWRQLVNALMS